MVLFICVHGIVEERPGLYGDTLALFIRHDPDYLPRRHRRWYLPVGATNRSAAA